MAPRETSDPPMADFRGLILTLRGRASLSQRELAALLGVSERAIQAWEAGLSYPTAARLQHLIALYVRRGAFTAGREAEEAAGLWATALQEAPRLKTPFDAAWFAALPGSRPTPPAAAGGGAQRRPGSPPAVPARAPRGQDWGEAPDIGTFHGRALELATLRRWVLDDGCRLVALLGMGGIGKTAL